MLKKNNKQVELESSESQLSSENQQNPSHLHKHSPNKFEDISGQSDQQMSDDEGEEQASFKGKHVQKEIYQGSSEQEQEEEEEDSLDDNEYFRTKEIKNGIHTIREDPKENLEDDSIDFIEQRIKKLEQDLQTRLNKHKEKVPEEKNHGKIISKPVHPPIPQKKSISQETENKMNTINQIATKFQTTTEKKAETKKLAENIPLNIPVAQVPKDKKTKKDENPEIKESKIESKHSQSSHHSQPQNPVKKVKPKKQQPIKQDKAHLFFNDNTAQLEQKISEMAKAMKQLNRLENQILKQKLESEKNTKEKSKSKSKTINQLERMKEVADSSTTSKLEKQIELLEVIEKLQTKLKKSISKKLAKQGNMTSSLLHKGLPTSLQSNF